MLVTGLQVLFSELVRVEIELWTAVDTRLRADIDIPLSSYEPMQVISRRGACRVQDIADEMVITVGGTSKLVDRLEVAGYCRRRSNPTDRRSSLVELTPVGKQLLVRASAVVDDELEMRLGAVLSVRIQQQFGLTLAKLRSAGQKLHHAAPTEAAV